MSANGWSALMRLPPVSIGGMQRLPLYSLLGGLALLTGFARELLVASEFGLSPELDAYVAVLGFHLFFGMQIGNALDNAFVSRVGRLGGEHVRAHLNATLQGLVLVNLAIAAFLIAFSGVLVAALFPAFTQAQQALAVRLTGFMVVSIALANMAGLMRGGLQLLGEFAPGFLSGSLISLCSIAALLLFSDTLGVESLVLGLLLGNLLVCALCAARLWGRGVLSFKPDASAGRPRLFPLWGAAAVVLVGEVLYQAQAMTERSLASGLAPGTIAAFFYASALTLVPLSLFVLPLVTTQYPRLTRLFASDRTAGVRLLLGYGTALALGGCAAGLILAVGADPLVRLVFMRGSFSAADAERTAAILSVLALALPFLCVSRLVRFGFYALGDYRTPVFGNLTGVLTLAGAGAALVPAWGARGLAVASLLAAASATSLMVVLLVARLRHG